MKHSWQSYDYNYLRPPRWFFKRKSSTKIYETDSEGNIERRNIYSCVNIPDDAQEDIIKLNTAIYNAKQEFPVWWSDSDSWRFLEDSKGNIEIAKAEFIRYIEYLQSMVDFKLHNGAAKLISEGNLFIGSRDKEGYPTLIIAPNENLRSNDETVTNFLNAVDFLLAVLKKFMMIPYYCEMFNIIIDIKDGSLFSTIGLLRKGIEVIDKSFKREIHKIFMVNLGFTTQTMAKGIVNLFSSVSSERFIYIKEDEMDELSNYYTAKNLLQRYGGNVRDIKPGEFWPPVVPYEDKTNAVKPNEILKLRIDVFYAVDDQEDCKIFTHENPFNRSFEYEGLRNSELSVDWGQPEVDPQLEKGEAHIDESNKQTLSVYKQSKGKPAFQNAMVYYRDDFRKNIEAVNKDNRPEQIWPFNMQFPFKCCTSDRKDK